MSHNLKKHFNQQKITNPSRIETLKAMGIHPEFLVKCEEMFEECSATVAEVVGIEEEIQAVNEEIVTNLDLLHYKRKVGNYKNFIDHAV